MLPHITQLGKGTSGIARVVEGYFKYLPQFGVELVGPEDKDYSLSAVHAGMTGKHADVCHSHGKYWTADYEAKDWEWKTNAKVVEAYRHAKIITVPSEWVAESIRRDMHLNPVVIPHGIEADLWSHNYPHESYILWNKNRTGDVCDIHPLSFLAGTFRNNLFLSTFDPGDRPNVRATGVVAPSVMKEYIQKAAVYLATTKETFGIGMLEAMASGVPVLGFAHGGALEIIEHGVSGYLAPVGDYDALAEGLAYCLQYRDVLGANGKELVRKWTWEAACELVANAYEAALRPSPPTAAIIIPSYNYSHLVEGAIQSAIDQDYPNLLDIIVVDDGSSDGGATKRIVEAFEDSRVRYIYQLNAGVANARNRGIAETSAKYVCCLDADDAIAPQFLSVLIPPMEIDQSLGLTYSGLLIVSHQGDKSDPGKWPNECNYDSQVHGDNQVPTCCVFRREAWKRLGGYRQRYAPHGCGTEDAEFWLRIGSIGYDMQQVTKEPLFLYRIGGNTTSGRMAGVDWLNWHPWTYDSQHPFASIATPVHHSHPVRQYDEPMVSVVIPVGPGHERIVIDALDSLEAQTLRQWEAIVVWDSPEEPTILDAYPFIRLVRTSGGLGAGYSRNRGAEVSRAPFLLFLDADDYLFPNALSHMLVAFGEGEAIIFSDSHGHVIADPILANEFKAKGELINYDPKTQLATIINHSAPYNYDKAVYQPDSKRPYFWCYISSLTPRLWHDEIGGFDETLPAWEDWDYWMRMARAGKPFVLVQEPLLVYRYYSGQRREIGRGRKKALMDRLVDKFKEEVEVMACRGCKQSKTARPRTRPSMPRGGATVDTLNDDDMVRIQYTHPNRGQHRVIGPRTKRFWGYRAGGDEFYVHRADMEAMPQWYREIRDTPRSVMVTPARITPKPVPISAPTPIVAAVEDADTVTYDDFLSQVQEAIKKEEGEQPPGPPVRSPLTIDNLPGISPKVSEQLKDAGIDTAEKILELGEKGLQVYKGVGLIRAGMIIQAVQDYLSEGD